MRSRTGFTMVELLVVVAIIALLASLAVINYGSARREAREKALIVNMKGIAQAVQAYRGEDFYRFTRSGEGRLGKGCRSWVSAVH